MSIAEIGVSSNLFINLSVGEDFVLGLEVRGVDGKFEFLSLAFVVVDDFVFFNRNISCMWSPIGSLQLLF